VEKHREPRQERYVPDDARDNQMKNSTRNTKKSALFPKRLRNVF